MKKYIIAAFMLALLACNDPSSIEVENKLSNAVIRNVEWGGMPIASKLLPGESSAKISIYSDSYYGINLPEEHRLKFYVDVNGDMIYLETKEYIRLGVEQDLRIEINDETPVINPLLED